MKKLLILCAVAILASCTHEVEVIDQKAREEIFENNFNSTFGVSESTYANHDWGMNVMPLVDYTNKGASTRVSNTNGNEWGTANGAGYLDYPHPDPITNEELAAVLAVFNQKGKEKYEALVDYKNFFVQQVYTGTAHYKDGNGSDVLGSNQMHELHCVTKYKQTSYWPVAFEEMDHYDWDYINNTNNANITANGGCTLMLMSSTKNWKYKSAQDGGNFFEYWRMEKINGNYYVGFDFSAEGQWPNQQVQRDYIYNDWIIKIVPGKGESTPIDVERVRVMCEDLSGSRTDFDYNDVVFDVKFIKNGNQYTADIILRAIGGELPLYIGTREVHDLFGVATNTMVNTYEGRHTEVDPVHFTVTLPSTGTYNNAYDAINALPVYVKMSSSPTPIQLTVNPGQPAEMIAVPVSTEWPDERESILNRYPSFVNWIRDSSVVWYE